jgi:hypothetical protein
MIFDLLETGRFVNGDEIFRPVGVRQAGHMIARMVPYFFASCRWVRNDFAEVFTTPYSTNIATIFRLALILSLQKFNQRPQSIDRFLLVSNQYE